MNNEIEALPNPDFTIYYKSVLIKTVWKLQMNTHTDQWNKIDNLEISQSIYGQLIFNKSAKIFQWEKNLSINGDGTNGQPHANVWHWNSKWINGLNIREKNYKTVRKKHIGVNLHEFRFG